MPYKKSPGGSMFPYPYKNGELFGLHMGSFGRDEDGFIARLKAEEIFFVEQNRSIGVWIDLYQTRLTERIIGRLIVFLQQTGKRILKLGLVGCSPADRRRITRHIQANADLATLPLKYFGDPGDAKTWLVSEHGWGNAAWKR